MTSLLPHHESVCLAGHNKELGLDFDSAITGMHRFSGVPRQLAFDAAMVNFSFRVARTITVSLVSRFGFFGHAQDSGGTATLVPPYLRTSLTLAYS